MSIPQSGGGPIESRNQLAEYLEDGCKPKADWRIGTEHEKFGYCKDSLKPLPYEGHRSVHAVLSALRDEFGWAPLLEGEHIIGLTKGKANVSLEPGGQLELSGAPGFIGLGASPRWSLEETPIMPKGRYGLMRSYMPNVGGKGRDMMFRTCTVQVNLDFGDEADMVTALFANSPFLDGKPNGFQSYRSEVWRDTDPNRSGMCPFVFEDGFGFERWVDYALDVPMYFVYRDGVYIDALGQSFRDFLDGKLPALPGEVPTLSDWADHLTTIFPEARLKKFIEMRGAPAEEMLRKYEHQWNGDIDRVFAEYSY